MLPPLEGFHQPSQRIITEGLLLSQAQLMFLGRRVRQYRSSGKAAINFEVRARDKSSFRAGEIRDHASHLAVLSVATDGSYLGHPLGKVAIYGIHIGVNRTRLNVVDGNAARSQIAGKTTGKAGDRPLRQTVDRAANKRRNITIDAANHDNSSTFTHVANGFLSCYKNALDVHRDEAVKLIDRELVDRCNGDNSCVVDENVETTEGVDGLSDGVFYRFYIGTVSPNCQSFSPCRFDVAHYLIRFLGRTGVGESRCLVAQSLLDCADPDDPLHQELVERRAADEMAICDRFERAVSEGDLPPDTDPAALARFVLTVNFGLSGQAASGASRTKLLQVVQTALQACPIADSH